MVKYELKALEEHIPNVSSFRQLAKKLNVRPSKEFNSHVRKCGIDISHFTQSHPGNTKYKSYIGKTIGKLKIDSIENKNKNIKPLYYAQCTCLCGNKKEILMSSILRGYTLSCGCNYDSCYKRGINSPNWSGIGTMSGNHFSIIKNGAKKRGMLFALTKEYIWSLYEKQGKRCIFTNVEIFFGSTDDRSQTTASLDRIDNNVGYIEGNVQWVHKDINRMRCDMTVDNFINACRLVSNNYETNTVCDRECIKSEIHGMYSNMSRS